MVCLLHNPLCVQQHETAFLREFSEEFAFVWNVNVRGVLFGRNNILGVLTVCSLAQVDRRVRQLKLVSQKCPCGRHLLPSSVHFGMYLSLIPCWPGGKQHLPGFSPGIHLSVHGNSARTKFEGVFFPLVCVCPCLPTLGNEAPGISLISVMSISLSTWTAHEQINFSHSHANLFGCINPQIMVEPSGKGQKT